jgi:hypothetical protein
LLNHDSSKLVGFTSGCPQAIAFFAKKRCPFIGVVAGNELHNSVFLVHPFPVPRFKQTVAIDDYVLDVLMRDLIGHDQKPAAFVVYLHLYTQAARNKWRSISASVRTIADATGLSKSAVHAALAHLRRRQLIVTTADHVTATPRHRVLRHWRTR